MTQLGRIGFERVRGILRGLAGWQAAGHTLSTTGLGSAINHATEKGDFHLLAAAVGLMAFAVVGINRLVWRPLSRSAQTRFSLAN